MNALSFRHRALRFGVGLATSLAVLALTPAARAEEEQVEWNPDWPRFRKAEIAFTAGMSLQFAAASFVYPQLENTWKGGVLFDDAARNALRLETRSARDTAQKVGDMLYYGLVAYPLVVDTAIVTWGIHGAGDVALQMLAMNLETYAFVGAVARSAEKLGRERPSAAECEKDPEYSAKCGNDGASNQSLLSGHSAAGFAGAGLMCAHHTNLPLYGGGAPDIAACAFGLTAATAVGTLRVMSDDHYATDVILGAALGLFGGYGMPMLLHYGFGDDSKPSGSLLPAFRAGRGGAEVSAVLAPTVTPDGFGVTLAGSF
ncbi:MAG TPA: phosphatase PAP2 family protein [Polyangiaceae bacterium]